MIAMDMEFNGCRFSLELGKVKEYYRQLNIRTGELTRNVTWVSPAGEEIQFQFQRIVSMKELHTLAQRVTVKPVSHKVSLKLETGIDGSVTNSGAQHFSEGDKRFYDNTYMQCCQTTTQTGLDFVFTTGADFKCEGRPVDVKHHIVMDRRKIFCEYTMDLEPGQELVIEKISNVFTSRDKDCEGLDLKGIQEKGLEELKKSAETGYARLAEESAQVWEKTVWKQFRS